ncbi:hypothetical protein NIES4072_42100 [Nostoc commune NIES-4072]|uniref:Uncharacterized protein n=1 Tax=Nostoc commune NIES-4072 TaxID=2005467 RepID=A0A2R5FP33_NOSCO|nr:hypothetical protein NIES4070_48750 [Nostoc commune HK-02]GBG20530.1 hypothetical protein NIES4072_42100 [Nostoc commune NIES-4072]
MSPDCLSTLTLSLGLSATTRKGDRLILRDEFYIEITQLGQCDACGGLRLRQLIVQKYYQKRISMIVSCLN